MVLESNRRKREKLRESSVENCGVFLPNGQEFISLAAGFPVICLFLVVTPKNY